MYRYVVYPCIKKIKIPQNKMNVKCVKNCKRNKKKSKKKKATFYHRTIYFDPQALLKEF